MLAELMPELRRISADWLAEKNTREKSFSLGCFDEEYLQNFPIALVRQQGVIVAFANLWCGAGQQELSIDLMRFDAQAQGGVMEYLFINLMLWGKEQGYLSSISAWHRSPRTGKPPLCATLEPDRRSHLQPGGALL